MNARELRDRLTEIIDADERNATLPVIMREVGYDSVTAPVHAAVETDESGVFLVIETHEP